MSDTKRKITVVIVLVLVILFGVGQFFAGSLNTASQNVASSTPDGSNQNPLPTQVISWVPPLPAAKTIVEQGTCFGSSVSAPYRSDAWRCTVGNAISDPCFILPAAYQPPSSTYPFLACGANPAGKDASSTFVLQLTKALPKPETPSSTPTNWAWLVQLKDGTVCSPFTGTRPFSTTGEAAVYACNGAKTGEDLIFGDLNNASATWTAEVGSLSTGTSSSLPVVVSSTTVPVFAVWE